MDGVTPEQVGPLLASQPDRPLRADPGGRATSSPCSSPSPPASGSGTWRHTHDQRPPRRAHQDALHARGLGHLRPGLPADRPHQPRRARRRRAASRATPSTSCTRCASDASSSAPATSGLEVLAPIIGVLCVTGEYRHKTITTTLVLAPGPAPACWVPRSSPPPCGPSSWRCSRCVAVAVVALPWNAALGGVTSQVTDQVGAVVPGLLASAVLLGLFGLGFGTLVKNQVAAILLTIGGTLILESILDRAGPGHLPLRPELAPQRGRRRLGRGHRPRLRRRGPGRGVPPPDLVAGRPRHAGLGPRAPHARLLHDVPPRRHVAAEGGRCSRSLRVDMQSECICMRTDSPGGQTFSAGIRAPYTASKGSRDGSLDCIHMSCACIRTFRQADAPVPPGRFRAAPGGQLNRAARRPGGPPGPRAPARRRPGSAPRSPACASSPPARPR